MKLNEEDFSSGTATIHFLDKPSQEKVIEIVHNVVNKEKYCQICTLPL